MNCIQAIVTLVLRVLSCIFSLEVRTNAIEVYSFNKTEPPGGCIVKETNPTGYPDDISDDMGDTTDDINDGNASDDDRKSVMLTG
jgi:hypothetical protein